MCPCHGGLPCFTHYSHSGLTSFRDSLGKQGWDGRSHACPGSALLGQLGIWRQSQKEAEGGAGASLLTSRHQPPLLPAFAPVQVTDADH